MKNNELLEQCFRKARLTRDLSESSIKKYKSSIQRFFSIIGEKPFEEITIEDVENYILMARDKGANDARIANVISSIKWAISVMQNNDLIGREMKLENVKKPKIIRQEVAYLSEKEITAFYSCVADAIVRKESVKNVRFMTLIVLLLQTGARIGEVLSIDHAKINFQEKEVAIIGKGGKPRTLFLDPQTLEWVTKYLALRKNKHEALFVSLDGRSRWQQTDIGRSFRRFRRLSGIEKKFTLHTLRHTFATQRLNDKTPLNTVQFLLGHSTPMTTLKYYVGAVEKENARKVMRDEYFDFIPSAITDCAK